MASDRATDGTAVLTCHKGKTIAEEYNINLVNYREAGFALPIIYGNNQQNTSNSVQLILLDTGGKWYLASKTLSKNSVLLPAITVPSLGSFSTSNPTIVGATLQGMTGTIAPGMSGSLALINNVYYAAFKGTPTTAGLFNYTVIVTQQVKNWRGTVQSEWLTYFPVEFRINAISYLNLNANGGKFPDQSTVLTQSADTYTAPTYTISTTAPTRSGYRFLGWSTSSTATTASYSGGGSYTGVLDGTSTLYAVWSLITYTHTIAYNANGGSGSMSNTVVTNTTSGNSNVTFAANGFTAPTGKVFGGWRINNTGTVYQPGNTYAVAGNASVTAYALWNTATYTVTITPSPSGYGSVSSTSITGVPYGSSITVSSNKVTINGTTVTATAATATAQYSYAFSSWSNTSGTITAARTITANFTRSTRNYTATIAVSPSGYGSVNPTSITKAYNSAIINSSNTVTVGGTTSTATPAAATAQYTYAFSSWTNGTGNLTANRTITANFTRSTNNYTATIKVSPAGYGTVSPTSITKPYNSAISTSGATVTVGDGSSTATPAAQTAQYTYAFSSWTNGSGNLTANRDITANFTRTVRNYAITVNVDSSANYGTISPTTVANKDYGSTYSVSGTTLTVGGTNVVATASATTAQYTYGFDGWYTGGSKITSAGTITGATTFTAKFTRTVNQYAISTAVSPADTGSVTGAGTYNYGATATLTATAVTDYVFEKWQDNNTDNPRTVTVTGTATYTAYFAPDAPSIGVKVNGSWVSGTPWVKANGTWVKSKKMYVKDNGTWKEIKRI